MWPGVTPNLWRCQMVTATQTLPPAGHTAKDPYFYGWREVSTVGEDGTQKWERIPLTEWDVLHPQEDDFIVQNDIHNDICLYLKNVFRWRLAGRPGALVLQDHRIDWQTADLIPHGPDIVVLFDSPPWDRSKGTYPVRDKGAKPVLVVEVTSPSTRNKDIDEKVTEYFLAGIPLYAIVDVRSDEAGVEIRLLAYRPTPEGPVRVLSAEPNRVWLPELNLWLASEGDQAVCLEPSGTPVGDYVTVARLAEEAEARAAAAEARATAAEVRADTEKARADEAAATAAAEKARADEAAATAAAEKARADEAAATAAAEKARADDSARELAELKAELRRLRGEPPANAAG